MSFEQLHGLFAPVTKALLFPEEACTFTRIPAHLTSQSACTSNTAVSLDLHCANRTNSLFHGTDDSSGAADE
jgi:hypothetical protein